MNNTYTEAASDISPWYYYITGIVLLFTTTAAIVMNGSIIYLFIFKDRKLLNRANTHVCFVCLISLITNIASVPMVIISCFAKHWVFGDTGCIYYAFMISFSGLGTILILTMFAIDRYILVEFYFLDESSVKYFNILSITGSCTTSFVLAIFPLLGWNRYTYDGVGVSCALDMNAEDHNKKSYQITLLVLCFILPIILMLFCFTRIFSKVKQMINLQTQYDTINTDNRYKVEYDLAITIVSIFVLFIINWTPYAIVMIMCTFTNECPLHPIAASLPGIIAKTAGCFTPLVYLRRNRKIWNSVLKLYPCYWRKNKKFSVNMRPTDNARREQLPPQAQNELSNFTDLIQ